MTHCRSTCRHPTRERNQADAGTRNEPQPPQRPRLGRPRERPTREADRNKNEVGKEWIITNITFLDKITKALQLRTIFAKD